MPGFTKGEVITVKEIRAALAKKHGATIGCPITTGIFTLVSARAAGEDEADGMKRVTPYRRTLKAEGKVNSKYPGGLDAQRVRLEAEEHTIVAEGKRLFVQGYERKLAEP